MADYYISPKEAFDATADAIRAKTNSQADIEWTNDGFADAVDEIHAGYTLEEIGSRKYREITGDYVYNGEKIFPFMFSRSNFTTFTSETLSDGRDETNQGLYVFAYCPNLERVYLPRYVHIGSGGYQFAYCTKLTSVFMPILNATGQHMFHGDSALQQITLPNLRSDTNSSDFQDCVKLEVADLYGPTRLYTSMFSGCVKLTDLILRKKSSITTLSNINVFNNTPFASGKAGGTLYVPQSMISAYEQATNWSTILGYENNSIEAIEGSQYENYFADGTLLTGDGINLLSNSEYFNKTQAPYTNSTATAVNNTFYDGQQAYYSSGAAYVQVDLPNLNPSQIYTLSFDVYRTAAVTVFANTYDAGQNLGSTVDNEWARFSFSFYGCENNIKINLYSVSPGASTGYAGAYRHFKLEKGYYPTAWTVAPGEQGGTS